MKIAIMQPYFFPYLGYFKLISKVDKFIFLDDAQYTRKGWINRNFINIKNPVKLTIPVKKASRSSKINEILVSDGWMKRHLRTFLHVYGKKCLFSNFFLYYSTLKNHKFLSPLLCDTVIWTSKLIGINVEFTYSSLFPSIKKGKDRIIELCKLNQATEYCNLPNGIHLYEKNEFYNEGININFIDTSKYQKISVIDHLLNFDKIII